MGAYIVADSSVFILGKELPGEVITVPSVVRELKDIRSRMRFQISDIRVESPSGRSLARVRMAAEETGDLRALSATDLEILAKALELGAAVATDDYALQNLAAHLDLKIEPVAQPGIRRSRVRKQRCYACKNAYEGDSCPVCGTPPRSGKAARKG
ncbi:MAG: Endoribonuclease Nob1 [Methanosaeta sp. PtaB.Bin039]|nr:MAG: Endoribonuclease Nob1 [Methanosaeta sp. PtaB.Bin039]OPY46142.1 MAG: Endoribonuclease Nob1 [Methanosaeta sp. PtaU1.Bin028]HOT07207.1 hypothetical protein [Methanotrichaceae archaeon]HQF17188.1 hypothetical protein [Methanotrichaceae archaeon]HQI91761.1 hypothetical protein [Methanotrichaceae archaeon]